MKILIVDDEPALLRILQVNLELEGHQTFLAGDGDTALRRTIAESPDVILLDIMMPVLDGWQVLKALADQKTKKRPRIIIMTAKSGEHDIARGIQLGADEYITKPFDIDYLIEAVSQVASRSEAENEAHRKQRVEEAN